MGVDVSLFAVGEVSDERLAEANAYVTEHSPRQFGFNWEAWRAGDRDKAEKVGPFLHRSDESHLGEPIIEYGNIVRYWGPKYRRGPWPTIYGAIRVLQAALPECAIHYAGDSGYYWIGDVDDRDAPNLDLRDVGELSLVTPRRLDRMWKLYLDQIEVTA
ncbi:hypothetical protein SEA_CLOWN_51 [Gordonia phage Clown]|uniref:Uncharacterized protein n=1 Tax=Gordonia phage Clown TaxID=2759393 RepID=A0A7L7STL0_9CAUD|nr:hypothetical protein KNV25_gp51 [Gordonia phage Clown]QOC56049.1 hypothetical protein SEA_CLOWN_51 [Gordonia phage Clown]